MDSISLKLEPRDVVGKQVRRLRREGVVPAVIHDHGKPSVVVQGDGLAMLKAYQQAGRHHTVSLKAGDRTFTALIRKADFDPKKNQLRHLVFNAVKANEKVEAEIPVHPRYAEGNEAAPAERAGLLVLSHAETVEVVAVPSKLPDFLEYDAEKLVEIGDSITVADLVVPEGVEVKDDTTKSLASVYEPSALQAANDQAGGDNVDETGQQTVEVEAVEEKENIEAETEATTEE